MSVAMVTTQVKCSVVTTSFGTPGQPLIRLSYNAITLNVFNSTQ